jgi:hypothetical protein
MAISFSKISGSVNRGLGQVNNLQSQVRSLTAPINQTAAQVGRLASQARSFTGQMGAINNAINQVGDLGGAIGDLGRTVGINPQIGNITGRNGFDANNLLGGIGDKISSLGSNLVQGNFGSILGDVTGVASRSFSSIKEGVSGLANLDSSSLNSIVGSFGDVSNFSRSIISVVTRGQGELLGAIGGEFEKLRQFEQDVSNLDDFINLTFNSPWNSELISGQNTAIANNLGSAASRLPNPLRDHNQFNYIVSIGILTASENNNPDNYRTLGEFQNYIIRGGGGHYDKRYRTFYEQDGEDAEYFIEDITFDAVIAPNPNTGVALGSTLSFTVIEPYSMGNFIQAIIGSAADAGYSNYAQAPFCLKIDFVGWNEDGQTDANFIGQPIFMPIKFSKIDFNVTGKGSTYAVQAAIFSEIALSDEVNKTLTDINAVGSSVHEILNGVDRSVTSTLNQRIVTLEEEETIASGDRFVIVFPRDKQALLDVVRGRTVQPDSIRVSAEEQVRREKGAASPIGADSAKDTTLKTVEVPPKSQLFQIIDDYSKNTALMNDIGRSVLVENTAEGGDQSMGDQASVHNEETQTNERNNPDVATAEKAREHKFHQGESITGIIEKILLKSKYAKENSTAESSSDGTRRWFKIDTSVFIDDDPVAEAQIGRPPRIYVYSIVPYFPDEAKFLATKEKPQNTAGLKASALKEYNYIYTGRNEDVLDFEIEFNNAFMLSAFANYGQNQGAVASNAGDRMTLQNGEELQGSKVNTNSSGSASSEPGAAVAETPRLQNTPAPGSRSTDIRESIAQQFHDRLINQVTDMVSAEMTILGDPFFIPQQMGNYSGGKTSNPNLTDDGTMNYTTNEVFVVVNFKTPFDYQVEGATMEFPQTVPQFSGLYSIWAVTSNFSGGKFTQTIKMTRRRGQDDEPTTANRGPIVANNENTISESPAVDTESNGIGSEQQARTATTNQIGATDPCATTQTIRSTGLISVSPDQFLGSLPIFGSSDITVPAVTIGDLTYSPSQGIFPSPARATVSVPQPSSSAGNGLTNPSIANIINSQSAPTVQSVVFNRRPPVNNT